MLTVPSQHDLAKENPEKLEALKETLVSKKLTKILHYHWMTALHNADYYYGTSDRRSSKRYFMPIIRIQVLFLKLWQ
ncbi:MAG: hypothetical protein MZV63_36310 [Marinilabiliales bacterium]|nr:hypothetical protein [Marinilabiliales bacterium]